MYWFVLHFLLILLLNLPWSCWSGQLSMFSPPKQSSFVMQCPPLPSLVVMLVFMCVLVPSLLWWSLWLLELEIITLPMFSSIRSQADIVFLWALAPEVVCVRSSNWVILTPDSMLSVWPGWRPLSSPLSAWVLVVVTADEVSTNEV